MGCGMGMIKYLLFIFNFIFALCGLAILIAGVVVHLQLTDYSAVSQNVMFPSITLIVIGSIIFVIAFFGCCGAIRESHCMTVTFASLLLTILILQVAVAIYAFVALRSEDMDINIRKVYTEDIFNKYGKDKKNTELVDDIQTALNCCGIDSYEDFLTRTEAIPFSCCGNPEGVPCTTLAAKNRKGCVKELENFFRYAGTALGGIALGIAVVELIGIIFALCLANSIRNEHRRGYRV